MKESKLFWNKLKYGELFEEWDLEKYFQKLKMVKCDTTRGSKRGYEMGM